MSGPPPEKQYLNDLISCPVCFEHYLDPRSLKCAHYFCSGCLKSIAKTLAKGKQNINCPICREVTRLQKRETIDSLPKPVLANQLQDVLKKLLDVKGKEDTADDALAAAICDHCDQENSTAAFHCFTCQDNMCKDCYTGHQSVPKLAQHESTELGPGVLCKAHGRGVTMYCCDCQVGICDVCIRKTHSKHDLSNIQEEARKTMELVANFLQNVEVHESLSESVSSSIERFRNMSDDALKSLEKTIDLFRLAERSLSQTKATIESGTKEDISALESYSSGLSKELTKISSMKQCGEELIEESSVYAIVARGKDFQNNKLFDDLPSEFPQATQSGTIEFSKEYQMLIKALETFVQGKHPIYRCIKDVCQDGTIEKHATITLLHNFPIHSILLDKRFGQLVLRTGDPGGPIKTCNYEGEMMRHIGADIDGLAGPGGIAIDTKRDLYVFPCMFHLITVTMAGQRKYVISMNLGKSLKGVAYIEKEDLYALSVCNESTSHGLHVMLFDAENKNTVRSFMFGDEYQNPDCAFIPRLLLDGQSALVSWNSARKIIQIKQLSRQTIYELGDVQHKDEPSDMVATENTVYVCSSEEKCIYSHRLVGPGRNVETKRLVTDADLSGIPRRFDVDEETGIIAVVTEEEVLMFSLNPQLL